MIWTPREDALKKLLFSREDLLPTYSSGSPIQRQLALMSP
jgi:hypothetical protein